MYLERGIPYETVRQMSLDQVDLENLLLDRVADAKTRERNRIRAKGNPNGDMSW